MKTTTKQYLISAICVLAGIMNPITTTTTLAGDSSALLWSKPVEVTVKDKPRRTRKSHRKIKVKRTKTGIKKIETVPLLSLRLGINQGDWADKPDPTKNPKPVNPENTFKVDEHLQLVLTVNQTGFLYIIGKDKQGLTMLYPHMKINNGENTVQKDERQTIPLKCDEEHKDKNGNCWFQVTPDDDDIILIFSRDKIDDLHQTPNKDGYHPITDEGLREIQSGLKQPFKKTFPSATLVQFTNLKQDDNEELIIETKVRHQ